MQKQIIDYIGKSISPFLRGYRKEFSTQYGLLSLIERWRLCLGKQGFAWALLMDLSKTFDTMNYELLIAKLHAYGFSIEALEVLLSYLKERWQRVRTNTTFSSWSQLSHKDRFLVLCCLILTSMICFLNEIEIYNFTVDTTLYVCDSNFVSVLES